jgi:hypothetical protein
MKKIIITDLDKTLTKPYDLYDLYNDFAIDLDDTGQTDDLVEEIRDSYRYIFESLPEYMNCDLKTFETIVLQFIL